MTVTANPLDTALRLAADDPASRPDFYGLLLRSEVFVITPEQPEVHGSRTLETDERISIQNWANSDGKSFIPFFTSLQALQQAIVSRGGYLRLSARSLFEVTKGATLHLNPGLPYGKEFFPAEIEALLAGGMNRAPERRITQSETKVLLGQPSEYPSQMVQALSAFFNKRSQVEAAYLLLMHDPLQDQKPHLVVGITIERDDERVMHEAGVVAADTAPKGEPVDLCRVVRGEKGLSEYFLESVEPFYKRGLTAKFMGLFRGGRT